VAYRRGVAYDEHCAGLVGIIVDASNRCIEDPAVIERILAHLNDRAPSAGAALLPEDRGPLQARLGVPDSSTESGKGSLMLLPSRKRRADCWPAVRN
jgi:hypothetical protein